MSTNIVPTTEASAALDQIKPGRYQHRRNFNPGKLLELANSIRESGLIHPPLVYRHNGHYELLAGERRWRAMCALAITADYRTSLDQAVGIMSLGIPDSNRWPVLSQTSIPIRVYENGDLTAMQTLATVENLQRQDLTPLEEAHDFAALREMGHSYIKIAKLTGKSQPHITGLLKWLELAPEIQQLMDDGLLHKDVRVAEALLSVLDTELRPKLARQFVERRSTVKAIVSICERANTLTQPTQKTAPPPESVPVSQVTVEVLAPAPQLLPQPQPPTPCLCPACAIQIHEIAEELCGNCLVNGLSVECLNCESVVEFINRLVRLSEAAYAA